MMLLISAALVASVALVDARNAGIKAAGEITCPQDVNDFLIPHPTDCSKFYYCSWWVPYLYTCPDGLLFNPDLDVCDWPENVTCTADGGDEDSEEGDDSSASSESDSSSSSEEDGEEDSEEEKVNFNLLRKL
eukprot:TRINITY_DN76313_c0_g1_i1.p1 TRINITY_DN76313_c0_g1~~TRINITY_DN76313_c0_g1_i1.p1  ORF type:complete len:132 (+),score=55.49 TRINITY_DN76313_c0_g1_i1:34-429(+)